MSSQALTCTLHIVVHVPLTSTTRLPTPSYRYFSFALQMHGTGTPLGDPIEVGALGASLRGQSCAADASPLMPMASKSWYGHAEPAAGFVGMALAVAAASHRATLAQLHLRTLNPHVADAVSMHGGGTDRGRGAVPPWLLPRAAGPAPMKEGATSVLTSISAFAFQVESIRSLRCHLCLQHNNSLRFTAY